MQKAEAQAREAQIEAALERVRSKTMAMHKTDELRSVIATVFEQVKTLGFDATACGLTLFNKEDKSMVLWLAGFETDSYPESYHVPYFDHPLYNAQFEAWEKGQTYQLFKFEGELKKSYDKLIFELGDFKHLPSSASESILNIETATNCTAFMKYGMLESVMIGDEVLSEQQADTLQRFAKVFEQTYTRFLDLQRAEAQAREAQIEVALERVRARTMGMQSSKELSELVEVVYQQFNSLQIANWGANIMLMHPEEPSMEIWLSENEERVFPHSFFIRGTDMLFVREQWEGWYSNQEQFTLHLFGDKKKEYDDKTFEYHDFRLLPDVVKEGIRQIKEAYFTFSRMRYGFLVAISTGEKIAEAELNVFSRFAKVFEQTYTRFLDLQRAEAQAREAQIEAALERVRASMMAMHRSDELRQVIGTMFSQLQSLGFDAPGSALIIYDKDGAAEHWMTGFSHDTYPQSYKIPFNEHPYFLELFQAWQDNSSYEEFPFEGPAKLEYTEWALEHSEFKNLPDEFKQEMKNPARIIMADAFNKYGMVEIMTPEPLNPDEISTLKRFSKVFEQTYTRFLDLQRAEAQAREAQIEAALERVRSRAIAMRRSDELSEAAELLYKEFLKMGVESFSCGYLINDDEKGEWKIWLTNPGVPFFKEFWTCPYFADYNLKARYESWQRQEEFHCAVLEGEENRAHHVVV